MPTTQAQNGCRLLAGHEQNEEPSEQRRTTSLHITELAQPVLELILIPGTSLQDKKAIRRVCKLFQQILDVSMVCLSLKHLGVPNMHQEICFKSLLQRAKNLPDLTTIVILLTSPPVGSLISHLPEHLTTLVVIAGDNVLDLEKLKHLKRLEALTVEAGTVTGFQHLTGLTSLRCHQHQNVSSLVHVAPTLKKLMVVCFQDVRHLTNLESLQVTRDMPADFCQTHSHLPLKHLSIGGWHNWCWLDIATAWHSAPTTLTRLTLSGLCMSVGVLPPQITHLQLVAPSKDAIAQAAALPGLKILDVCLHHSLEAHRKAFGSPTRFDHLLCLGFCIDCCRDADSDISCHYQQILSVFTSVAMAVEHGVQLRVYSNEHDILGISNPWWKKSEWANHLR